MLPYLFVKLSEFTKFFNYYHSFLKKTWSSSIQTFEDSKKLALEKNNEVLYLEFLAEQNSQNFNDNLVG